MTKKGYKYKDLEFRQFQRMVEKQREKTIRKRELKQKIEESAPITEYKITYKKRAYTTIVYRQKGKFISRQKYEKQQIRNKEIPEYEKDGFYKKLSYKTEFYRASVAINGIPVARKYYSATLVRIDKLNNIDIEDMKKELLKRLESSLHYPEKEWWFLWKPLIQIQEPKPYFGSERGDSYEYHKTN